MPTRSSRLLARALTAFPRRAWTRLAGQIADLRSPRLVPAGLIRLFVRSYGVDLGEAAVPEAGFPTLNAFFTRALREGARPVDPDPASVVSPADGRLDDAGPIDPHHAFVVKGQTYDAARLLGSAAEAAAFAGGAYAIVYLAPRDYHRVHSPVAGRLERVRHVGGSLLPVNAFGVAHYPGLLARNERVALLLRAPLPARAAPPGPTPVSVPVAVVLVGAVGVGRITLAVPAPGRPGEREVAERAFGPDEAPAIARGAELGAFSFGSTVVVLLPKGCRLDPLPAGSPVRYGQRIGSLG